MHFSSAALRQRDYNRKEHTIFAERLTFRTLFCKSAMFSPECYDYRLLAGQSKRTSHIDKWHVNLRTNLILRSNLPIQNVLKFNCVT